MVFELTGGVVREGVASFCLSGPCHCRQHVYEVHSRVSSGSIYGLLLPICGRLLNDRPVATGALRSIT